METGELLGASRPVDHTGLLVPRCMDGTRKDLFSEVERWLGDPHAPNIFWIRGSPGIGKSAIASSLMSKLIQERRLGSFYFFKRGDIVPGDSAAFWRTVAYDLAKVDSAFSNSLSRALKQHPAILERNDIDLHFKLLIEENLVKILDPSTIIFFPIIVVDALDEFSPDNTYHAQQRALLATFKGWSRLSRTFKMIVTSRQDECISRMLQDLSCSITLPVGVKVNKEANDDIWLFFDNRFDVIRGSLPEK
jgi:hypothetical protein